MKIQSENDVLTADPHCKSFPNGMNTVYVCENKEEEMQSVLASPNDKGILITLNGSGKPLSRYEWSVKGVVNETNRL